MPRRMTREVWGSTRIERGVVRLRAQPFEVQHGVLQEGLRTALLLDERVHLGVGDRDALLGGRAGEQGVQQLVGDDVASERRGRVLLALFGGHAGEQGAHLGLDLVQRHGRVADDDRRARLHRAAASADQRACGRDGDQGAPHLGVHAGHLLTVPGQPSGQGARARNRAGVTTRR